MGVRLAPLVGVVLAALLALLSVAVPRSAAAQEPNRAGLVVQYPDGRLDTRCVEFEAAEISGTDLLERSGLETVVDASSGLGITVCQIEGQGCAYPAEPCFCQCSGTGACAYWNYYTRDPGGPWGYAAQGALLRRVGPGAVEAWVWGGGGAPPGDELSFEAICPAAVPPTALVAATATASPAVAALAAAPTATARPPATALAAVTLSSPAVPAAETAAPSASAGGQGGYWLFGLMAAGLVLAGLVVWLRGRAAKASGR